MNYLKKELYSNLKTNPKIFEFIENSALDGMWYWDLENPENEWKNNRFWETLGYNPEKMPHKSSILHKIIHKDDYKLAMDNFNAHIKDPNIPYDQVLRYIHKKGKTVWIRSKGIALRNNEGKAIRMVGSNSEITKLKENEQFLDRCNQEANIGFWDMSVENQTIAWSNTTKKMHGVNTDYEPDLETSINFYKEGESRTKITELVFRALNFGEPFNKELQIVTIQGENKWVKVIGIPEKLNDKHSRLYGTIQDINDIKRYQIKLEQSEQAFRGNFENAAIGMALLDRKGKWLKINQTLCDILGYTTEELKKLSVKEITHPEDYIIDENLLNDIIRQKKDYYKIDKRYFHKKGHIVYIHLAVSVVRGTNKEVLYFISQVTDITRLKEQERDLKRIISITQDQNDRLKNFAHIVSHNLRSHSGGISALLNILRDDEPEYFENELMDLLETSSSNLEETIDHLSEVVKINLSSTDNLELLSLNSVINKQISNVISLAEKNEIKITNNITNNLKVLGIPAYLESIILNFITNAIKYSSNERDSFLTIDSEKNRYNTIISFTDNGVGINLDLHRKKLFGMYKTFHGNEDARGIGLFITKNQIETLGGKIEVTSTVNKGTTFKVYFKHEKN
jgi:PAS domain S-box-containing protein